MTEFQGITFLYFLSMKRLFSAKKKEVYANYLLNMRVNFAEKNHYTEEAYCSLLS